MATLDGGALHCEAGPSRVAEDGSRSLSIRHACHLEQPGIASWFGSDDKTSPTSQSHQHGVKAYGSLTDRYAETLWLGEFHTGLNHFLNCIDRLTLSHDLEDVVLSLCQLIKPKSAISRRHQAAASALPLFAATAHDPTDQDSQFVSRYEWLLIRRSIENAWSGHQLSQVAGSEAEFLRERWSSSTESREIQLQILVTMCLLQIVSQAPRALEIARSRFTGNSMSAWQKKASITMSVTAAAPVKESDRPRKRSRKLEKAKRWRGPRPSSDASDAFAWNQHEGRRLAVGTSHDDGDNGESELLEVQGDEVLVVEHLSKRLEALVDILCLRQVAGGVGSELADLLADVSTETSRNASSSAAKPKAIGSLFGSSVRKLVEDDDMDDAQWLCSSVIEPHFEASLPRQCSLFRSKCFVSLQSRTPAKTAKTARVGSLVSPLTQTTSRGSITAAAGPLSSHPSGGLSDVLEKEQAGRRVKRTVLAERSSRLGRGREVDMGRRLFRSVSATSGAGRDQRAPLGAFSRSSTSGISWQSAMEANGTTLEARNAFRSASQNLEAAGLESNALSSSASFAALPTGTKRKLVMSTPKKEPASKMFNMGQLSQLEKPKFVYRSLVMESPTQDGTQVTGQRWRTAERCASFGGQGSFGLNRSPSPVTVYSDAEN